MDNFLMLIWTIAMCYIIIRATIKCIRDMK
jgi:hypothetical protein